MTTYSGAVPGAVVANTYLYGIQVYGTNATPEMNVQTFPGNHSATCLLDIGTAKIRPPNPSN